jgi:glutaredoxin
MELYDLLKAGYSNDKTKQKDLAEKNGYNLDTELSNKKHQFYINDDKHLIHTINGTQNRDLGQAIQDWNTNLQIALGRGEKTKRFKEEKNALEKAKKKHNPTETTIVGHSQSAFHATRIGDKDDKVVTYNGAFTTPVVKSNNKNIRTFFDPVSLMSLGTKNTKTIPLESGFRGVVDAHGLKHLKGSGIKI